MMVIDLLDPAKDTNIDPCRLNHLPTSGNPSIARVKTRNAEGPQLTFLVVDVEGLAIVV